MAALLDTCILVDLLRRSSPAQEFLLALPERPRVCPVSTLELYAGARAQREERRINAMLATFERVGIDDVVFQHAGSLLRHYRSSHALDIPDALIAATAEQHGLALATLNDEHFPMFKQLKAAY